MHPEQMTFLRIADGRIRQFKRSTKVHLKMCPHCGQPVDTRYWAEHRNRLHKKARGKGDA